jgi:hypothetical protein
LGLSGCELAELCQNLQLDPTGPRSEQQCWRRRPAYSIPERTAANASRSSKSLPNPNRRQAGDSHLRRTDDRFCPHPPSLLRALLALLPKEKGTRVEPGAPALQAQPTPRAAEPQACRSLFGSPALALVGHGVQDPGRKPALAPTFIQPLVRVQALPSAATAARVRGPFLQTSRSRPGG